MISGVANSFNVEVKQHRRGTRGPILVRTNREVLDPLPLPHRFPLVRRGDSADPGSDVGESDPRQQGAH